MKKDKLIPIPEALFGKLQAYRKKTNFSSPDDLVAFILQDYLDRHEMSDTRPKSADDEEVMKRLQDLGYM